MSERKANRDARACGAGYPLMRPAARADGPGGRCRASVITGVKISLALTALLLLPVAAGAIELLNDGATGDNDTLLKDHVPDSRASTMQAWGSTLIYGKINNNQFYSVDTRATGWCGVTLLASNTICFPVTITAKISLPSLAGNYSGMIFGSKLSGGNYYGNVVAMRGGTSTLTYRQLPGNSTKNYSDVSTCAVHSFAKNTLYPVKVWFGGSTNGGKTIVYWDSSGDEATTPRLQVTDPETHSEFYIGFYAEASTNNLMGDNLTITDASGAVSTATPTPTPVDTATPSPTISATYTPSPTVTPTPVLATLGTGFGATSDWVLFNPWSHPQSLSVTAGGNTLTVTAGSDTTNGYAEWYYQPSLAWNIFNVVVTLTEKLLNFGGEAHVQGFAVVVRYNDESKYARVLFPSGDDDAYVSVSSAPDSYWANYNQTSFHLQVGDVISITVSDDGQDYIVGVPQATYTAPHIKVYINGDLKSEASEWTSENQNRSGGIGIRARSETYQVQYSLTGLTVSALATATPTATPTAAPSASGETHQRRKWWFFRRWPW